MLTPSRVIDVAPFGVSQSPSLVTEPVMVPRWVRGLERAEIVDPAQHSIDVLGLGGSVATPAGGIEAEVVPIGSFDELRARQSEVRGRIVLFDVAYTGYTDTVTYRTTGARTAALYGAVAVLVRSIGPIGLRTTHTGSVAYSPDQRAIPAAAISSARTEVSAMRPTDAPGEAATPRPRLSRGAAGSSRSA